MTMVELSRQALGETLLAAGPGRDTLCEGWRTQELAAHLYLREHRPSVAAGIVLPALAGRTERKTRELAGTARTTSGFTALVGRFLAPKRVIDPRRLRAVDTQMNLLEYFVHTEDVRRAVEEWAPRVLDAAYEEQLWRHLVGFSRLAYRSSPVGVVLVDPEGYRHVARRAAESVAVTGAPGELLMHAFGRRSHALVDVTGPESAVRAFAA